jgi:hypothetical protein
MTSFAAYLWIIGAPKFHRPIAAIAIFGEPFRKVPVPGRLSYLPTDLEIKFIGMIIRKNFRQNDGRIPQVGGEIRYYVYHRRERERWAFTGRGRFIGKSLVSSPLCTHSLHLRGKPDVDISFLFRRHVANKSNRPR